MENKERNINIFSVALLPLGLLAFVSAVYYFPVEEISATFCDIKRAAGFSITGALNGVTVNDNRAVFSSFGKFVF